MLESKTTSLIRVRHKMKQWKQVSATAATVLALTSGAADALGLGQPTSRAILGESLRMSVPLELESGEDGDDGCPQVEVHYGDNRVDAGKVILGISPQTGRNRVVTVRAIQPIDEPLIEVNLVYGCGARLSRKFMIFASPPEFVPTVVLSPATANNPQPEPVSAAPAPITSSVTSSNKPGTPRSAASPTGDAVPRAIRPVPVKRPLSPPLEAKPSEPPRPAQPAQAQPIPAAATQPLVEPKPTHAAKPPAAASSPSAPASAASSVVLRKPVSPKPAPAPRLELDPVRPAALSSLPGAAASSVPSGAQPDLVTSQTGSPLDQLQSQLAQDRRRIQEMEKVIAQLRHEAAQASAAASGVGLTRPSSLMDANHPIWLLAISTVASVSLLFSAYLFVLLRRQEREREWWSRSQR